MAERGQMRCLVSLVYVTAQTQTLKSLACFQEDAITVKKLLMQLLDNKVILPNARQRANTLVQPAE